MRRPYVRAPAPARVHRRNVTSRNQNPMFSLVVTAEFETKQVSFSSTVYTSRVGTCHVNDPVLVPTSHIQSDGQTNSHGCAQRGSSPAGG